MSESVFTNLIPGNFEDDMSVLAECDWILEAVIERIDIKKDIHSKINEYRRPGVPGAPIHLGYRSRISSLIFLKTTLHAFEPTF